MGRPSQPVAWQVLQQRRQTPASQISLLARLVVFSVMRSVFAPVRTVGKRRSLVGGSSPNFDSSGPLSERCSKTYRACLPIGQTESIVLLLATNIEMLIVRKEFGIVFRGCVAFSTAAQDIASFLDIQIWPIKDPSIVGRASLYSI